MADIIIDMEEGEVAEANGELIPTNDASSPYKAKIEQCELTPVKNGDNKGKPMYSLRFRLLDGPGKGRVMFANACLWYEARFTLIQIMKATGHEITQKLKVPKAQELVGKEVGIIVKHGTNQFDELRHEVARIVPLGGAAKSGGGSGGSTAKAGQRVNF